MFPPPRPWKKVAEVEPDREYLAFTSRFYMKSPLHVLSFLRRAGPIQRQVENAPGAIGYSLGMNLFKMEFYTLSAWQDAESLQKFAGEAEHKSVSDEFASRMRRKSLFVHYNVRGSELPLSWADALARQRDKLAAEVS
jgi:hypothetical protein